MHQLHHFITHFNVFINISQNQHVQNYPKDILFYPKHHYIVFE